MIALTFMWVGAFASPRAGRVTHGAGNSAKLMPLERGLSRLSRIAEKPHRGRGYSCSERLSAGRHQPIGPAMRPVTT